MTSKPNHSLEIINNPVKTWNWPDWGELWRYRFLLLTLVQRELLIRYKQTLLGVGWAVMTPLITLLIFTFVFTELAKVPSEGVPYILFGYAGLIPWGMFSTGLTYSATSIVSNRDLITRLYFPRLIAPLSKQFAGLMDTAISLGLFLVLMMAYGYWPNVRLLTVPLFLALGMATSLGVGLWFCTLHVRFRDIGPAVPLLVQLWLYLSPVAYPSSLVAERWRVIYGLNPMVTVCDGFRWALLGLDTLHPTTMLASIGAASLVLVTGLLYFQRMEGDFPDDL